MVKEGYKLIVKSIEASKEIDRLNERIFAFDKKIKELDQKMVEADQKMGNELLVPYKLNSCNIWQKLNLTISGNNHDFL